MKHRALRALATMPPLALREERNRLARFSDYDGRTGLHAGGSTIVCFVVVLIIDIDNVIICKYANS